MTAVEARTWDYRVLDCLRVVDGDTYDLTLSRRMDFGFRLIEDKQWSMRFRMLGGDAWEKSEAGGAAATQFSHDWIWQAIEDDVLRGQTFKADDFGRWLLDLYRTDNNEHLVDALREHGHIKPGKWDTAAEKRYGRVA